MLVHRSRSLPTPPARAPAPVASVRPHTALISISHPQSPTHNESPIRAVNHHVVFVAGHRVLGGSPTYICIWLIIKTIPSAATMTCMGFILSDHPVEETRHMLMSDPSLVMACHCHFSTPDHDARSPTALRHCLPQSESFTD